MSVDSTITRVHQHGATLRASQGAWSNYKNPREEEPADHAIGKSRGGLTCKIHLATDGKGRPLGLVLTGGNAADTSFLQTVVETIECTPAARADRGPDPSGCWPTRPTPPKPTATT